MEAIAELKRFSLTRVAREAYEAHLKEQRDGWAREDYVKEQGLQQGKLEEQQRLIANMRAKMLATNTPLMPMPIHTTNTTLSKPMKNAEIMPTDTNALVLPNPRNT